MRRSEQRRAAVIALYQHDLTGRALAQSFAEGDSEFVRTLAQAAAERATELDEVIDRHAHGWSVSRTGKRTSEPWSCSHRRREGSPASG